MAVFWVVAPCSLVEVYRRFRGQPEDSHLHTYVSSHSAVFNSTALTSSSSSSSAFSIGFYSPVLDFRILLFFGSLIYFDTW
jgi:hypothetical protein